MSEHELHKRSKSTSGTVMKGLSKLGLGEKPAPVIIQMAISDRSIYEDLNMVFTPPRIDRKMIVRYENTYKMEPEIIPNHWAAFKILERVVNSYINNDTRYNSKEAEDLVRKMSVNIKRAVKGLAYPRYKTLAVVTLGERHGQYNYFMGKCLWDFEFDTYSTYNFENQFLFVIATVFMIYYE